MQTYGGLKLDEFALSIYDLFCHPLTSKLFLTKNSFINTTRASNGLDPDQDQSCVGPDLGPNCLQR